ncbi:7-cyano-7-deazaguanine synthase [Salinivibrio kushneri]|uniref:7-cyano-7-deazaguanine synthase n=1 Tax=Salinivibrio kushneri TaxID=1908198 RepID=UPI000988CE7C|nr:7-cyano-7-deazaguanine synthase [Salinivibrio kushneri]OOE36203.1 7-cyano-7-deazaguanine synthase [Salinivibrio kushneri]
MNKGLVLLSGGLDSIALAYWLRPRIALTIDYGQRASQAEISAASMITKQLGIKHFVEKITLDNFGSGLMSSLESSSLTDKAEFWPFRNQMIITLGAMMAVKQGADNVYIGTVSTDSRHMDGSQSFLNKIDDLISMQEGGVNITAPAKSLTTYQLIEKSKIPLEILLWGHSCHVGNLACGCCPGCMKQSEIMSLLGINR